jgi:hypothetical protein
MSSTITAGNATNGLAISADNTGALELKTGTGAGTTALTLSTAQAATFAGTVTAATGTLYPIVSGTSVTALGASVDFTGIPSWVKRITVQINGLSYAAVGAGVIQIGAGSLSTSGYTGNITGWSTGATTLASVTTGFGSLVSSAASTSVYGVYVMTLIGSNAWVCTGQSNRIGDSVTNMYNGSITLGGTLDRLSLVATTSTFDAGTVNILYE